MCILPESLNPITFFVPKIVFSLPHKTAFPPASCNWSGDEKSSSLKARHDHEAKVMI